MSDTMNDERALRLLDWVLGARSILPGQLIEMRDHIAARLAQQPAAAGEDRYIAVPIALPALAVSDIKDMLSAEYGMEDVKARPLWASLLTIVAGISLDDQIALNEQARAAPQPVALPEVNDLIVCIQDAMNALTPPAKLTETRAEYWKAGARAAINAVNIALDKHARLIGGKA